MNRGGRAGGGGSHNNTWGVQHAHTNSHTDMNVLNRICTCHHILAKNYTYTQQMHNNTWDHNTSRQEGERGEWAVSVILSSLGNRLPSRKQKPMKTEVMFANKAVSAHASHTHAGNADTPAASSTLFFFFYYRGRVTELGAVNLTEEYKKQHPVATSQVGNSVKLQS